jgi:transcriptional regulator with XRE-family HTH domain
MDETFIAKRLARLRTERGVSARDMSLSIGQANNYISNIENGKSQPSIQGLFYICEYLGISPQEFFDENTLYYSKQLKELVGGLKSLNETSLFHITGIVKQITGEK